VNIDPSVKAWFKCSCCVCISATTYCEASSRTPQGLASHVPLAGVREVARDIGISHATLSRVERGHLPDLENYQKICKWLGVDIANVAGLPKGSAAGKVPQIHFRKKATVIPETAQALAQMNLAAQAFIENKQERE
jgi:transcriptional regulator with XRE-family HTH domain